MPPGRPSTLIARNATAAEVAKELPMIKSLAVPLAAGSRPAWISEALQDLYGYKLGESISLPLAGREQRFTIAGIWRDYARAFGAVVISRTDYIAATGDESANEGSVWLDGRISPSAAEAALRSRIAPREASALEILTSTALRERSLQIFDRAFAITYALEAIAVIIGLTGISFAASSTALARRAEFGMLRHIGMLRRQVVGMLASEGRADEHFRRGVRVDSRRATELGAGLRGQSPIVQLEHRSCNPRLATGLAQHHIDTRRRRHGRLERPRRDESGCRARGARGLVIRRRVRPSRG